MEGLLGSSKFPPGFRFHPTDEELFMFYLKRKVLGKSLGVHMMNEVDVYRFAPWDLPPMACLKSRDLNWYFFCPRSKKYPNGARANRATEWGYWKSTGNDKTVKYSSRPVGKIKTLIFHRGKAPKGERTDWVMYEYRLEDFLLAEKGVVQDSYVICKIFEKSGLGPKNGENYGARFVEEEWDSDTDDDNLQQRVSGPVYHTGLGSPDASVSVLTSSVGAPNVASPADTPPIAVVDTTTGVADSTTVGYPSTPVAFMGTPYAAASVMGTPYSTAAASNAGYMSTSAPFMGTPNIPAAPVGIPTTSVGMQNVTPAYDVVAAAASATSSSAFPNSVGSASAFPEAELTEDELHRLLQHFTEDVENDFDIYNELGDLADPCVQNFDWGDYFIEMNDLE